MSFFSLIYYLVSFNTNNKNIFLIMEGKNFKKKCQNLLSFVTFKEL